MVTKKAEGSGVRIAVDAEQSYLQLALDVLTLDLMRRFNTKRPVIFNTYQCYRTVRLDRKNLFCGQ